MSTETASLRTLELNSYAERTVAGILIISMSIIFYVGPPGASVPVVTGSLVLFYIITAKVFWRPTYVVDDLPTFASIEVLFLFFYFLIFYWPYQQFLMWGTSLSSNAFLDGNTYPEQSNRALLLANIGIVAFHIGIRSTRARTKRQKPLQKTVTGTQATTAFERQLASILTVGLAPLVALYVAAGWRSAGEGRYTGSTSGGSVAEGVSLVILMLSMMTLALMVSFLAQRKSAPPMLLIGLIISGYWAFRLVTTGDRNGFLLLAIVGVGGLCTYRLRVGRLLLAAVGGVALVFYNVVENTRMGYPFGSALAKVFTGTSPYAPNVDSSSFNITTVTVRAGLAAVPGIYDFGFGWFKAVSVGGVIPLIRGALIEGDTYVTSSQLVTAMVLPPDAGWDVGSNLLTDIYVDFGLPGVVIIMFLIGLIASVAQSGARDNLGDSRWTVCYLVALALIAEWPRYSFDFPVRIMTWGVLIIFLATWMSRLHAPPKAERDKLRGSPIHSRE